MNKLISVNNDRYQLAVSINHGRFAPQYFMELYGNDLIGVTQEDRDIMKDTDHVEHFDTWSRICANAILISNGNWTIEAEEDIWLVRDDFVPEEIWDEAKERIANEIDFLVSYHSSNDFIQQYSCCFDNACIYDAVSGLDIHHEWVSKLTYSQKERLLDASIWQFNVILELHRNYHAPRKPGFLLVESCAIGEIQEQIGDSLKEFLYENHLKLSDFHYEHFDAYISERDNESVFFDMSDCSIAAYIQIKELFDYLK